MPPKASSAAARPRRSSARTTPRKTTSEVADVKSSPQSTTDASPETTAPPSTTTTAAAAAAATAVDPATSSNLHVADIDPQIDSESALPETSIVKVSEANPKIGEKSGDSSVGTLVENASEIKESGATKTVGARTVVKKTVRVVKRVVKKKVPKRVPKGQAFISSVEELGKVELVDNGSENPNPSSVLGDMEVENPNSVGSEPNASVSMELGKVELADDGSENPNPSNVLGDTEVENPNSFGSEPNASVSMEMENSNSDVVVLMEAENPNSDLGESSNSDVPGSKQVENLEEHEAATVTELVEVTTETHLGDQNERLVGDRNDELETENVGCGGSESKEVAKEKDVIEGLDVGGLKGEVETGDVVWSGEMEALERRKRRKTEVFVGGLDKDAKEEDIRKVLQEVGEIVEVRLVMNEQTGKNKGFAFVRYASSADAKKALTKFARVEICGKQCGAVPVEGNDTIFLGNIDKKWKSEDIVKLMQEIGIEKMDKVTVVADPNNIECNRGFAFLELETCRAAQNAYRILQKKDVFGKHQKIKVAWAEPLSEPDEEEMLKVKTVYAEYLPSSWDEEKVKDYFKKFGEIENVVLARNLHSSRRKDFAFVNYRSREAALACIEAFSHESLNHEDSKVNVKVSLAKPMPKGRQVKNVSNPVSKEPPKEKMKANQSVIKPHQPRNKINYASSNHVDVRVTKSSTTAELVQLLREQASWRQPQTNLGTNSVGLDYPRSSPARKRPFSLREDPLYLDPRGYSRTRIEGSFTAAATTSGLSQGIGVRSLPYYNQQEAGYASGSFYRDEDYHNSLQARGGAPYHGSSGAYRRY